jgi:serine phosphatase RsbU (regulator of sigma subunit)
VSGDFFWATTFGDYQVFCVADCTGHGVPGAFMSILGITALNDIVSRHKVTKPSEILGYLRESVIEALSQNDPEQLHKDGMDIALCVLNTKTRELQFAGAGLPLWIVSEEMSASISNNCSSEPITTNGFSLCEVKGDIMPVGQSPRMTEFTNHTIMLGEVGIRIYLSSDGYSHQPGGAEGRKFQKQQLLEKIIGMQGESLESQKSILDNIFEDWKNNHSQIDDVTVLGIKI